MKGRDRSSQHMAALAKGDEIRIAQAAEKRRIADLPRPKAIAEVIAALENPNDTVGRMTLKYLLRSIPRMGAAHSGRLVAKAGLPYTCLERRVSIPRKRQGHDAYHFSSTPLTEANRRALADELRTLILNGKRK